MIRHQLLWEIIVFPTCFNFQGFLLNRPSENAAFPPKPPSTAQNFAVSILGARLPTTLRAQHEELDQRSIIFMKYWVLLREERKFKTKKQPKNTTKKAPTVLAPCLSYQVGGMLNRVGCLK